MRKTPFHDVNIEWGAQMQEMFGYYLPWQYSPGGFEEHVGTRERASLCDLDYMGELAIEGPEALSFVQHLLTVDCGTQAVGQIKYTTICNHHGVMLDDGTVWRIGDDEFMLVTGDEGDFEWVTANALGFDVSLENITGTHTTLALQGPKAKAALSKVTNADLSTIDYYRFIKGEVCGVSCLIARIGYTGEFGFEVHFAPEHSRTLWQGIMVAGADLGIVPCGQMALESLRQEAGYILVGNEHCKDVTPLEAGAGFTLGFTKDQFVGRQALADQISRGLDETLVWFDLPDGETPTTGNAVLYNDRPVGRVTSGSYSPTREAGTAMGYVAPRYAIPGVQFTIRTNNEACKAKLSRMPLYDPGDLNTKGVL